MKLESLRMVVGSCAVYAIVAACSAGGSHSSGKGPKPMEASASGGAGTETVGGMATDGAGGNGAGLPGGGASNVAGQQMGGGADQAGSGGIWDPVPSAVAEPKDGTRLKARYLVGADGSRQWNYGWFDTQRGENCSFNVASDGVTRCLPINAPAPAAGSGYFADDACMQPLVTTYTAGCNGAAPKAPKSAYRLGSACGVSTFQVYEVGAAYTGANVYTKSGTSCPPQAAPAGTSLYHLGEEVPAGSFVAATEEVAQ